MESAAVVGAAGLVAAQCGAPRPWNPPSRQGLPVASCGIRSSEGTHPLVGMGIIGQSAGLCGSVRRSRLLGQPTDCPT